MREYLRREHSIGVKSLMVLTQSSLTERYKEQGYVIVEGLIDADQDLEPIISEYKDLLDTLASQKYKDGIISSTYSTLPFGHKLAAILNEAGAEFYQNMEISLPQRGVLTGTPIHHGPATFNLLRNPNILDAVEEFIGPEIFSNPVQHIRIKPPEHLLPEQHRGPKLFAQTIWHQDQGTVTEEADESEILTVWIPVVDATEENGCLTVVPGSHKNGLNVHCDTGIVDKSAPSGTHEIPNRIVGPTRLALPMKAGDVLFMNKLTMHASLPNVSDGVRWSFDLRYNPTGQPTGRPWFPGFIARSRSNPESELRDPEAWAQNWRDARNHLANIETPEYQRWGSKDPLCG